MVAFSSLSFQTPEPASPVERWWQTIRKSTVRQVVIESALSLPVPQWVDGELVLAAFYYRTRSGGGPGKGIALPPFARLVASYPEARILEFTQAEAEALFPGMPIPAELGPLSAGSLSVDERNAAWDALFTLYPNVLDAYRGQQPFDEREKFSDLFFTLLPPGLAPFCTALNPAFFTWLGREEA
jgi:hypothetical protein